MCTLYVKGKKRFLKVTCYSSDVFSQWSKAVARHLMSTSLRIFWISYSRLWTTQTDLCEKPVINFVLHLFDWEESKVGFQSFVKISKKYINFKFCDVCFSAGWGMNEVENNFLTHSWESGYKCMKWFRSRGLYMVQFLFCHRPLPDMPHPPKYF